MIANSVSNVIQFPISQRKESILSDSVTVLKDLEEYCDELTSDIMTSMLTEDFPVDSDDFIQDISLLFESVRSIAYKSHGLFHPVQDVANTMFFSAVVEMLNDQQLSLDLDDDDEV